MGQNRIEPHGRFAQYLAAALTDKGLSLRDLAQKIDFSYEHLRMVEIGDRPPSEPLLEKICKALDMDFEKMRVYVVRDKMERTHGAELVALAYGKSPRISQYEELVPHLTSDQNKMILETMRAMVNGNRKRNS